jgi:PAS domain S-box-containing protein
MAEQTPLSVSLYHEVEALVGDRTPVIRCSKATLVHMSHTLEDMVLRHRIPAMMFTGFQESSYWKQETRRYRELAGIARQICIFAGNPLPADQDAQAIQVELAKDDPLRQEWFVLILSDDFSALLTGQDLAVTPVDDEASRLFDVILTFDPAVIEQVLRRLDEVLAHYRPDRRDELFAARKRFPLTASKPAYITEVVTEMLRYEEALNQRLRQARNEQVAVNAELRHERDFSRKLIESSPAFFTITDLEGRIIMMNPVLQQFLGYDQENFEGQVFWEVFALEDDREIFRERIQTMQQTGQPVTYEAHLRTADDERVLVEWRASLIRQSDDQPRLVFAMGIDISDRERAEKLMREEERLRAALKQERQLSELRNQFMSTVSHEFRTPLATILTSTELLERHGERMSSSARQRRLERIKEQIEHLNTMVDEISTVIRTSNGYVQFRSTETSLPELIEGLIQDVQLSMRTSHMVDLQTNWTRGSIQADPRLIQHIFTNLLSNAMKYSPGSATVHVQLYDEDDEIVMIVRDEGIGIPPRDQDRLYDSFYRGSNVGARGGTGLGLRIVADCVNLYDGSISYQTGSTGTTFTIRLPIDPPKRATHGNSLSG